MSATLLGSAPLAREPLIHQGPTPSWPGWTGYLGGAIATHLRLDNPLFTHILFPIYVAALLRGGLYLRDERIRALLRPATAATR